MSIVTDLYTMLFGKEHLRDSDVVTFSQHGRVGGVSTGQGFGFTDSPAKAIRLDIDSGDSLVTYIGRASLGAVTSDAVWQIKKIDENIGTIITIANGSASYDQNYDNRESLSYS